MHIAETPMHSVNQLYKTTARAIFSVLALFITTQVAVAQTSNCPFRLVITELDGSKSCLSDLPIGQVRAPNLGNLTVREIAAHTDFYHVAVPRTPEACPAIGVAMQVGAAGYVRADQAKAICEDKGCTCDVVLSSGRVVSYRLQAYSEALKSASSSRPEAAHLASPPSIIAPAKTSQPEPPKVEGSLASSPQVASPTSQTSQPSQSLQTTRESEAAEAARKREEEARLASAVRKAEEEERVRQQALIRQREAEAEAARRELARVKEQLAKAQQTLQAQKTDTPAATPARRKALVIGNDAYTRVAKLEAARADAKSVGQALSSVGFEVSLHTDMAERPLKQALRDFKGRVQAGDEVVFFFAGHGVQIAGTNFLLPTDIQGESEDQVRDEGVQVQRVLDDMQERGARFTLAVIDACRDNPFRQSGRAIGGRGLAPTAAASGQMIIFSAGAGQQALDRLGQNDRDPNGVFTRVFVREMVKPDVPVDRVLRAVRNEVVQMARSVGKDQTPALYDQAVGDFFFKKGSP